MKRLNLVMQKTWKGAKKNIELKEYFEDTVKTIFLQVKKRNAKLLNSR